jgi:hypothetical protein
MGAGGWVAGITALVGGGVARLLRCWGPGGWGGQGGWVGGGAGAGGREGGRLWCGGPDGCGARGCLQVVGSMTDESNELTGRMLPNAWLATLPCRPSYRNLLLKVQRRHFNACSLRVS